MEKENRITPSRRRAAALAGSAESAFDGSPADRDPGPGPEDPGLTQGAPGARNGGPESGEGADRSGSALPRRVRGKSDGPRPPAQVARPVLPPSFLERVRAAAEAEQRLEQRAQERADPAAKPVAEPAPGRPGEPRRPARFVRRRDWMTRNAGQAGQGPGGEPGPGPHRRTADDQSGPARQGQAPGGIWTARGGPELDQGAAPAVPNAPATGEAAVSAPEPGGRRPPSALPRRRTGASQEPDQPGPDWPVTANPAGRVTDANTEPIPVVRVPPGDDPLGPGDLGRGSPALGGTPAAAAVRAPDRPPAPAPTERAPAEQASREQAPREQVAAAQAQTAQTATEKAPVARDPIAPGSPGMVRGPGRRARGKLGLQARVARGLAAAPRPPAGVMDPQLKDTGRAAPQNAAQGARAPDAAAREAVAQRAKDEAAAQEAARQAAAKQATEEKAAVEQAAANRAIAEQAAAKQAAAEQAAAEQAAAEQAAAEQAAAEQAAAKQATADKAAVEEEAAQRTAEQQAAEQQAAQQETAKQRSADQRRADQQAQQTAARRAADEAAVQRAAASLARRSSSGRSRRLVALAAAIVVAIGGVTAGLLFLGSSGHKSHVASPNSGGSPTVNRDHAAAWIASQVNPATVVSCDPVTCVVLESHGFPASHVRALGPGKGNPLVSDVVVATPTVRRLFGARLTSVYAPGLLAAFGSGSQQVDIRLVAPRGAAAYRAEINTDLQNRRLSGAGLSASSRIQAPYLVRKELAAGQVDSRLMITLAFMVSMHPVDLVAFGDGGPDRDAAPFRSAQLSLSGSAGRKALAFLRAQQPPYLPTHITTRSMGRNRTMLVMEFAAPSPIGLFH